MRHPDTQVNARTTGGREQGRRTALGTGSELAQKEFGRNSQEGGMRVRERHRSHAPPIYTVGDAVAGGEDELRAPTHSPHRVIDGKEKATHHRRLGFLSACTFRPGARSS